MAMVWSRTIIIIIIMVQFVSEWIENENAATSNGSNPNVIYVT